MRALLISFFILVLTGSQLFSQQGRSGFRPEGKWNFEAPSAPDGYNSGTMEVVMTDNKLSVIMGLPGGGDYKMPAYQVQLSNELFSFKINIQDEEISVILAPDGEEKLTGKAVYSGGETMLTCKRVKENK